MSKHLGVLSRPSLPPSQFRETPISSLISVWARTGNHLPLSLSPAGFMPVEQGRRGTVATHSSPCIVSLILKAFWESTSSFPVSHKAGLPAVLASTTQSTVCPYPASADFYNTNSVRGTELPPCSQRGINQTRKMGGLFVPPFVLAATANTPALF